MRPLAYPLTPVPASIATNVFLYTSPPTRCCSAFLKCPKDGTPGKSDGKTCVSVSLCVCVFVQIAQNPRKYECIFLSDITGYTFTSFLPSSVPSFPLFIPQSGRLLCGTLHGLSAWISSSDCNPNNCFHHLCYLHNDQVWLFHTVVCVDAEGCFLLASQKLMHHCNVCCVVLYYAWKFSRLVVRTKEACPLLKVSCNPNETE